MATSIKLIQYGVQNVLIYKKVNIPSKVFFKNSKEPKVWYHLTRDKDSIHFVGKYIPSATYKTVKNQIFNNIPISGIERRLVASRAHLCLTMEEIQQFINELRVISNRKEE